MRIANLASGRQKLKRGTELALCEPVASVTPGPRGSEREEELCSTQLPDHIGSLLSKTVEGLGEEQKAQVSTLFVDYQDVFSKHSGDIGRAIGVQHKINTGDAVPLKQPPRRLPIAKREEADRAVEEMEKQIIEPSSSPWSSPVVLVRKKDGTTRFCVDYRRLNDVTRKDSFPLPRIDTTLDSLNGSHWFSTLDLKSGYWQVELDADAKEKTAFSYGKGLWQFTVMPFGLCNAPATFERLMETVLAKLPWQTCLVYLDDIIVLGKDFDQHVENLKEVFDRLRSANLKLNPKKCSLFQKRVTFLGYVVTRDGIETDPEKVKIIRSWSVPTNANELRSFLGLCTYYRRFVPDFAKIAAPLHSLTHKNVAFHWNEECEGAFQSLKERLSELPILIYPDVSQPFILDTDASDVSIGAVLSQCKDEVEHPVAYFSKTLSSTEKHYCVTRKELLAVVKATEHFHSYLYGNHFVIRTDHSALQWLLSFKNPEGQMARWVQKLGQYDFEIRHRKGRMHGNADALSRRPCDEEECKYCDKRDIKEAIRSEEVEISGTKKVDHVIRSMSCSPPSTRIIQNFEEAQRQDSEINVILQFMKKSSRKPSWDEVSSYSPAVKVYWGQWEALKLIEGKLYRCLDTIPPETERKQLIVPKILRGTVLEQLHNSHTGGHFGMAKTLGKVRERYFWPYCRKDVEEWCRKCEKCASRKGPRKKQRGPMKQFNVGAPLERIAIDVLGPLPTSGKGNKYILIVGDYFTKWAEAYPLENQRAEVVAEVIVKQFIARFGVPLQMHSDQGRNFESAVFSDICVMLGIDKTRTTALHPESDGMVERFNRTLENQLAIFVERHQKDWDKNVPLLLMSYRSAIHESTKETPANVMFGRELNLPIDLLYGRPPSEKNMDTYDYVSNLKRRMANVHEFARIRMQVASDRMKRKYDIQASKDVFEVDELVWLYNPKRKKGLSPKLTCDWEGPYIILKRINELLYRIRKSAREKPRVVHRNRLWRYTSKD